MFLKYTTMINAKLIAEYVSDLEIKAHNMEREIERGQEWMQRGMVSIEKFYAVKLTIPEVARLHNVNAQTVRSYVKRGFIEKHQDSTDGYTYIRASVALTLDFGKLRKESRWR